MRNLFIIFALVLAPLFVDAQTVLFPNRGGTGTTTIPTFGQVLMGQANGTYAPVATSSLGIVGTGGGSGTTTDLQIDGVSQGDAEVLDFSSTDFTIVESPTNDFDIVISSAIARDSELHSAVTLSGTPDYITLLGQDIVRGLIDLSTDVTGVLPIDDGGTGANLTDPNDDRILFWDDTAGAVTWLDIGTNLSITGTTINGSGDVSKVGTPVDNQIGVWTGDGTIEGDADFTFDGGLNITVANAENKVGLTINQNDTTNNPDGLRLASASAGNPINVINTRAAAGHQYIKFDHQTTSATALGGFTFYGNNSVDGSHQYGTIIFSATDATDTTEDGKMTFSVATNGATPTQHLAIDGNDINGITVGDSGRGNAVVESNGNNDLILQTGNATTGSITITDGANGDIIIAPNGTGDVVIGGADIKPDANDSGALGEATTSWSDLFLASGSVINFNNGDVTLTHGSNVITLAGGGLDAGGADFVEIPNGTAPTANDPGEIAHDTTDNQLIMDDFVVAKATQRIWGVTVGSTSPAFISGGLLKVPTELDGYTMTAIRCSVQGGTSKVIAVEDESTNSTEDITCATSVTSDDGTITNASVTAAEEMYIDFGATTGAVDYVSITVFGQWTRE